MTKYVEWVEPHGDLGRDNYLPVIVRAKVEDVIKFYKRRHPAYESDGEALFDFMTVYWAQIKEYDE